MIDGLYRVVFTTQIGAGTGVVHLMGGKLWGGDATIFYTGTYSLDAGRFTASVKTGRHSEVAGSMSVFGIDRVDISLKGTVSGDTIEAEGAAAQAPGIVFNALLIRVAD